MESLKNYLSSFRLKKIYFYTLAVDALAWLVIGGMFTWLLMSLKNRLGMLTGGLSAEAFQQYLLSLPPEQATLFAAQIKTAVIQLSAIIFVLPIIALLLYSLSRALLWSILLEKEFHFKEHWKWNLLTIMLCFIAALLIVFYLIVQLFVGAIAPSIIPVLGFLLVVGFVVLMFLAYRHFMHTRKVFESLGSAFKALKQKKFYIAWAFGAATIFVLRFVMYPFREQLFIYQDIALYIGAVIALLWLAWFRMYVVAAVE